MKVFILNVIRQGKHYARYTNTVRKIKLKTKLFNITYSGVYTGNQ